MYIGSEIGEAIITGSFGDAWYQSHHGNVINISLTLGSPELMNSSMAIWAVASCMATLSGLSLM